MIGIKEPGKVARVGAWVIMTVVSIIHSNWKVIFMRDDGGGGDREPFT